MQTIEIDFEVFKALTALRETESVTYNDVVRGLLKLGEGRSKVDPQSALPSPPSEVGFDLKGLILPNGTMLRATYKGRLYLAEIKGGEWVDELGRAHSSPSSAATQVTGTNVNGWRFWEAKRPSDATWRKLDAFPRQMLV